MVINLALITVALHYCSCFNSFTFLTQVGNCYLYSKCHVSRSYHKHGMQCTYVRRLRHTILSTECYGTHIHQHLSTESC